MWYFIYLEYFRNVFDDLSELGGWRIRSGQYWHVFDLAGEEGRFNVTTRNLKTFSLKIHRFQIRQLFYHSLNFKSVIQNQKSHKNPSWLIKKTHKKPNLPLEIPKLARQNTIPPSSKHKNPFKWIIRKRDKSPSICPNKFKFV